MITSRSGRLLVRLDALDHRLAARSARSHVPGLDQVLPRLTASANHSVLWTAVAAALAASGGRRRRAAVRGLVSLALASATTNVPAKLLARRARPQLQAVPLPRQLLRQPKTSSFPSGHAASATAFALGVALESPAMAAPVGLLAAGVAYGRVHTGVHYPGDVLAGAALGGAAVLAVRRVWPVRPDRPAVAPPALVTAPALPDGAGLVVVVNASSGSADDTLADTLRAALPAVEVVRCGGDTGRDVGECLRDAAARATVLGVAGGDGTVNCAAGFALEAGIPLVVIPGGTLDHFAGELGIRSVDDVIAAVRSGEAVSVSVGSADAAGEGLYFLNTFALGIYPELVRERERREDDLGKWPALLVALAKVLPGATPVRVMVDGEPRSLWTLFAGNGHYHPAGFAPSWRERLDDGCIDIRLIDAARPWSRVRMVAAVLTGRLAHSRVYTERIVAKLPVHGLDGPLVLARDGEVGDGPTELLLRAAVRPLVVYRPA